MNGYITCYFNERIIEMSRSVKLIGLACLIFGIVAVFAVSVEPARDDGAKAAAKTTRQDKAKQIASAFFNSLMRGDTAVTTALSDVPFAWDRKQTIESIVKLEELFESIVNKKGKRDIKATAANVVTDQTEIQQKVFPADYIIVKVMIGDEGIDLCVKPGDTFKVVGFSD